MKPTNGSLPTNDLPIRMVPDGVAVAVSRKRIQKREYKLYRDHETAVITNQIRGVTGFKSLKFRTVMIGNVAYVRADHTSSRFVGASGKDALIDAANPDHVRYIEYVCNYRVYPQHDDHVYYGPFISVGELSCCVSVTDVIDAAAAEIIQATEKAHEARMTGEPRSGRTIMPDPASMAPTQYTQLVGRGVFVPGPQEPADKLSDLKQKVRERIAAEEAFKVAQGDATAVLWDRLDALQASILEAVTLPTTAEQLAALRIIAEELL